MFFPKPLGAFYIALLSSLVSTAQKKNNCSIVNSVVTGAMIYLIVTLVWNNASPPRRTVVVTVIMTLLETFQLTLIPLGMTKSGNFMIKIVGRLLGTTFSWLDLAAYFVGITAVYFADYLLNTSGWTQFEKK